MAEREGFGLERTQWNQQVADSTMPRMPAMPRLPAHLCLYCTNGTLATLAANAQKRPPSRIFMSRGLLQRALPPQSSSRNPEPAADCNRAVLLLQRTGRVGRVGAF